MPFAGWVPVFYEHGFWFWQMLGRRSVTALPVLKKKGRLTDTVCVSSLVFLYKYVGWWLEKFV